jgi:hypothetical protein
MEHSLNQAPHLPLQNTHPLLFCFFFSVFPFLPLLLCHFKEAKKNPEGFGRFGVLKFSE